MKYRLLKKIVRSFSHLYYDYKNILDNERTDRRICVWYIYFNKRIPPGVMFTAARIVPDTVIPRLYVRNTRYHSERESIIHFTARLPATLRVVAETSAQTENHSHYIFFLLA